MIDTLEQCEQAEEAIAKKQNALRESPGHNGLTIPHIREYQGKKTCQSMVRLQKLWTMQNRLVPLQTMTLTRYALPAPKPVERRWRLAGATTTTRDTCAGRIFKFA